MYQGLELQFASNGPDLKIYLRRENGRLSSPLSTDAATMRKRSATVRQVLSQLNDYGRRNPKLSGEVDPEWSEYHDLLQQLQEAGEGLRNALFDDSDRAKDLLTCVEKLQSGGKLTVQCSDRGVTPPLGFVFDGEIMRLTGPPHRSHFGGFWLTKYKLTMLIEGGGCEEPQYLNIDPSTFKALYALHRDELAAAAQELGEYREKLKRLLSVQVKDHYDWPSAHKAWSDIDGSGNLMFVLAHSDGDELALANSRLDSGTFRRKFRRRSRGPATLLVLNCCFSATGGEGDSLLSVVAQSGFSGLIGTEAAISNVHALKCGTRLIWDLCTTGKTLGEAFEAMQRDEALFPGNLFYTCYADRDFRLTGSIPQLLAA